MPEQRKNKSLFASFSSEKEEVFFFEKKNQKTFMLRQVKHTRSIG
jgi:hypothetical protein